MKKHLVTLILITLLAVCAAPTQSQVPAAKALETFTVSPGLELSLWASEPMMVNPTCMDIDHRGRVWVCESVNYRSKLRNKPFVRPEGDRILILEDTQGTGKADTVTVFYQSPSLLSPLGIAVAPYADGKGCKVFICQSPDILVFEDRDGDGQADGPPAKLLTGFKGFDHDHGVHGILIGPDGKLYFSVGDQGVSGLVDKNGKKWSTNNTDCRAGTNWRCDLDGKNLELLAHNFRNQYEPCVDSFGNMFVSDNDDDGNQQTRICFVMPGGNYGYHPRGKGESHWHEEQPGVVHKILRTYFGSPTGMCVYEGTLLPKKYHGQPLHTDAGPRHLRCYHLTSKGAGYSVAQEEMVQSKDSWFRPSDVCVAPDGAVFVADWYDPGVGGHAMGDIKQGRIYRLAPTGNKPAAPTIDLKSEKGLLAALASPNLAVRYLAMNEFWTMDRDKALPILGKAYSQKENAWLRARALWQIGKLDVHYKGYVQSAFEGDDPSFCILAMRIFHDFHNLSPASYSAAMFGHVAKHPSAAVRREALLLMRNASANVARDRIFALAKTYDGEDHFFLAAVGIAVGHLDKERRDIILADFSKTFTKWSPQVAGLIWELRPPQVLPLLEQQLGDASLPFDQRRQIVDIVAGSPDANAGDILLKAVIKEKMPAIREAMIGHLQNHLPGKWAALKGKQNLKTAIETLATGADNRLACLALIGAAEWDIFLQIPIGLAEQVKEPAAVRRAAVETLARFKSAKATEALLVIASQAKGDEGLVLAAVLALGEQKTQKAQDILQHLATDAKHSLGQRQAAVAGLAKSRPGTEWLLESYEKGRLAKDLKEDLARLLHSSPFPDLRNKALIALPAPGKIDPKNLPSIAALLAKQGDVKKGRDLMLASITEKTQCLKCHTIRGTGGAVGPDLSMIGKKASRENLMESILYPHRAISDQYINWIVETNKGLVLNGLIIEDSPKQLVLRDANAQDHVFKQGEVASKLKSPNSIMPDNLLLFMSESDLVDMVDYLGTLKTPALSPAAWNLIGPFPNGPGDAGLKKAFPPEQGINLNATYTGKLGPVKWQPVKPDAKGYMDLQGWLKEQSADTVSYAHCEVDSPVAQQATILIGTDDGARLWVNGKSVYKSDQHRAAVPEQDSIKVELAPGRNMILLKIANGDGPHGFYLTILSEQPVTMTKN